MGGMHPKMQKKNLFTQRSDKRASDESLLTGNNGRRRQHATTVI